MSRGNNLIVVLVITIITICQGQYAYAQSKKDVCEAIAGGKTYRELIREGLSTADLEKKYGEIDSPEYRQCRRHLIRLDSTFKDSLAVCSTDYIREAAISIFDASELKWSINYITTQRESASVLECLKDAAIAKAEKTCTRDRFENIASIKGDRIKLLDSTSLYKEVRYLGKQNSDDIVSPLAKSLFADCRYYKSALLKVKIIEAMIKDRREEIKISEDAVTRLLSRQEAPKSPFFAEGDERRRVINRDESPLNSVVQLRTEAGECSGAVVLNNSTVATSAHCLKSTSDRITILVIDVLGNTIDKVDGRVTNMGRFHSFVKSAQPGEDSERVAYRALANDYKEDNLHPLALNNRGLRVFSVMNSYDWAVVKAERPLMHVKPSQLINSGFSPNLLPAGTLAIHAGYPLDWPKDDTLVASLCSLGDANALSFGNSVRPIFVQSFFSKNEIDQTFIYPAKCANFPRQSGGPLFIYDPIRKLYAYAGAASSSFDNGVGPAPSRLTSMPKNSRGYSTFSALSRGRYLNFTFSSEFSSAIFEAAAQEPDVTSTHFFYETESRH
jgi:V8-like Glu-specific endopeptidase